MLRDMHGRYLSARRPPRGRSASSRRRRLNLEWLEDRVVPSAASWQSLAIDAGSYDPGRILVRLRPGVSNPGALHMLEGARFEGPLGLVPGLWEVKLDLGLPVPSALEAIRRSPLVLHAQPNYRLHLTQLPNDPRVGEQWGFHNSGQTGGTQDADIDAAEAWDLTTGSPGTIVAVIDSGIDYNHPDLAANIWLNPGEVAGNGVDDDGNGFVDDLHGYDFVNGDADPMDDQGHGTHVAGTIGAVGNNGLGVAGINWNVRLMALKIFDASGSGSMADAMRALEYAVGMGARVSNNSYGGLAPEDNDPLFREAIENAAAFGHVFVAAAGNNGGDNDSVNFYPAGHDVDNILAVAATDHTDQLASFSNYGATRVDLAAPGVDILSTMRNASYGQNSGTSMAAPHVAGVVALVQSYHPEWTYRQVIDRVLDTVDYVPALDGRTLTAGRLNAARALRDTDGPRVVATDPSGGVGGLIGSMRVVFNESIDPASFDAGDIESFTGPGGPIAVTGVSVVPGSRDRKFELTFAPQFAQGGYQMVLGPAISDRSGNAMDQDADGLLGESGDDRFTASFTIGDRYVFRSADTPKALAYFSTTVSTLVVDQDLGLADLDVQLDIDTADVGLIDVALVSPGGTRIALAPITGDTLGPEYRETIFDDEAATAIGEGTSPFAGSYRPAAPLSALDNQSALGAWRLEVLSLYGGTLNSWALLAIATPPRLSIGDVTIVEGDAGSAPATFTVRLSNAVDRPITVDYATGDGTATGGDDYEPVSGRLTFAPGEMSQTVTVAVRGDTRDEPDETFFVDLANPDNATIADGQARATIRNDEIVVSIDDITLAEGNGGTVDALFPVRLSAPSTHPVTVSYATAPGTAAPGTDYVAAAGTLTFAPGETIKMVAVAIKGDTRHERAETFLVELGATDALLANSYAVGTISNDDPVPVVSVNDVSATEGDAGTKTLVFGVALSAASDDVVAVAYATADGTAIAGGDYGAASGALSFSPGQTYKTVSVVVTSDTTAEPNETFFLNLGAPTNAILLDGQGTGTILTDDVRLTVDDVAVAEGDGGPVPVSITVRLDRAVPFEVRVAYATANGTAAAGIDYVANSGSITFAPGQTTRTIGVLAVGDVADEADELFFVNLSGATDALIADGQGRVTLGDDDPVPVLTIGDAALVEGNSGTRTFTFTVGLSAPSGKTVTVGYATADGSATVDRDYRAASGTLTFTPGVTSRTVSVVLTGDAAAEPDEEFSLNLSEPVNATILDGQAIGTVLDDDSLVVDDTTVAEGDAGTTTVLFTVRLLEPRGQVVTVDYATANGTATAGTDYLAASGTLSFLPGETTRTVAVAVVGDRLNEADETLFLNLSNAVGAGLGDIQARGTITNDDAMPSVSIGDAALVEGNAGSRSATFTVTLSAPSGQTVTVQYATGDGTATAGADYQPRSGTLFFGPGSTTGAVSITVNGDTTVEGDETFIVNAVGALNAILADDQATALVIDDDALPALSIGDVTTSEGNSGTRVVYFAVTLSAASSQAVTVQATTADGTAAAGDDYVAKSESVTFSPGQTYKTVGVTIKGDIALEPTEMFSVLLSVPSNAVLADAQGSGTIQSDDSSLRVGDVTVTEGDDGATTAVFTVSLTGAMPADTVSVAYDTVNGTATSGNDYVATRGTLTFAPGQASQTVGVLVLGDVLNETNESFSLRLSGPTNATIADAMGVATLLDDDASVPSVSLDDTFVIEGASGTKYHYITARLSAPSGKVVTVNYATANGTATAGTDYQAKTGTLTFYAGSTSQTISILLYGDTSAEDDEYIYINLTAATNATIADAQALATIQDDDSLVVDDVAIMEGDSGTTYARFTVRLLAPRGQAVTVNYATANGTAAAGTDYLAASGTLSFAPGESIRTVDVVLVGDVLNEAGETFYLNLSGATGAIIADAKGAGTILDDDPLPGLSVTDVVVAEGNMGTKSVTYTIALSQPSGQAVTVAYATEDGTATASGGDYQATNGLLTFFAGQTTRTVTVIVNGDWEIEGNEDYFLVLSGATNATIDKARGTSLIVDDEVFA